MKSLNETFQSEKSRKAFFARLRKSMSAYPRGAFKASSFFGKEKGQLQFFGHEEGGKSGAKIVNAGPVSGVKDPEKLISRLRKVRDVKTAPGDPVKSGLNKFRSFESKGNRLVKEFKDVGLGLRPHGELAGHFTFNVGNRPSSSVPQLLKDKGFKLWRQENGMTHSYSYFSRRGADFILVTSHLKKGDQAKGRQIQPYIRILKEGESPAEFQSLLNPMSSPGFQERLRGKVKSKISTSGSQYVASLSAHIKYLSRPVANKEKNQPYISPDKWYGDSKFNSKVKSQIQKVSGIKK